MLVKNLKLIAKTEEDIKVVSAHLQDSILNVADIANLKKNKIFLMQLNRFMWEDVEKGVFRKNKRIRTVLKFDNVLKTTSFSSMKKLEETKGFVESKIDKKTGAKIPFFNLGPKNDWKKLLDPKFEKKLRMYLKKR